MNTQNKEPMTSTKTIYTPDGQAIKRKKDILILGDFNINLLNYNNDKDTFTFLDTMFPNSFLHFITTPTRSFQTLQKH